MQVKSLTKLCEIEWKKKRINEMQNTYKSSIRFHCLFFSLSVSLKYSIINYDIVSIAWLILKNNKNKKEFFYYKHLIYSVIILNIGNQCVTTIWYENYWLKSSLMEWKVKQNGFYCNITQNNNIIYQKIKKIKHKKPK